MSTGNGLVKLKGAVRALAEAKTLDEIKHVHDIAQAAAEYARAAKLGLEAQNHAAEVKIRAERKAGELLKNLDKSDGGKPTHTAYSSNVGRVSGYRAVLEDTETSYQTANRWQQVAALPEDKFEKYIAETTAASQELTTAGVLRFEREVARKNVIEQAKELPQPSGKYRVFYADPPWSYGNSGVIGPNDNYGHVHRHYPSMTIEELCTMGSVIRDMAEDNAVLFIWVTSPLLAECFDVIRAWGFSYKTSFVWDKIRHNFGHYNSVRHEFLLVCTRGSCTPDNPKLYDSVQEIERSDIHSEKPEEFRAIIDDLYEYGERIELFARREAQGWFSWGNQM
jgi:N6-adenosine-specific RNA methylase IME4